MATSQSTVQDKSIVERAWQAQDRIEARVGRFGRGKYGRVLRMARKPTPEEYRKTSLVAGAGIAVLGFLGFTIFYIMSYIPQQ